MNSSISTAPTSWHALAHWVSRSHVSTMLRMPGDTPGAGTHGLVPTKHRRKPSRMHLTMPSGRWRQSATCQGDELLGNSGAGQDRHGNLSLALAQTRKNEKLLPP